MLSLNGHNVFFFVGLHLMSLADWETAKRFFRIYMLNTLNLLREIALLGIDETFLKVIWRDTWAVHEYCFFPNAYRFQSKYRGKINFVES